MITDRVIPAFVAAVEVELLRALEGESGTVFAIDVDYRIAYVNPAWSLFAQDNGGQRLISQPALGLSLRAVIPDVLKPFYDAGLGGAFATGQVWLHEYECSSDRVFRRFRMRVLPLSRGPFAIVSNDLIHEEVLKRSGPFPAATYRSDAGLLVQCAQCRRISRQDGSGQWDFVPALVRDPPDKVSHGLCVLCLEYHYPVS